MEVITIIKSSTLLNLLFCVLASPGLLLAQSPQATVSGIITDSTGAVVPGAQVTAINPATTQRATTVTFFEPNRRTGYSEQFNLNLQQELPGQIIFEVGYIGNLSRKLPSANLSIDQITLERLAEIAAQPDPTQRVGRQIDRPYPQFSNVTLVAPAFGVSNYHALTLQAEKRFAAGFNFLATYTWSKFLNNTDDGASALGDEPSYSNYYDRASDYGPSANDIRHRLTISSVYELPVGRGKHYLSNGPLGAIAGNWSVGLLALVQSGPPATVTTQTNNTNAFSAGAQRANILSDPNLPSSERTLDRWFDTSAFAQPAAFSFGMSGRGVIRGDGVVNFDISLLRNFFFAERKSFQFRLEMFNAFNHTDFGLPGTTLGGPDFGVVSSALSGRSIQLGLRAWFSDGYFASHFLLNVSDVSYNPDSHRIAHLISRSIDTVNCIEHKNG